MSSYEKVKIIVAGDSGVGKTSLVSLLCHNEPLSYPSWTIGCSVEVKLHDFKVGTSQEKTFLVELWDVGGSAAHKNSRNIFYNSANGIILVHDLTNRKSHLNLKKWLLEVLNKEATYEELFSLDCEQMAGRVSGVPLLMVGTKFDSLKSSSKDHVHKRTLNIAEELGADAISLDSSHVKHIAPGTSNAVKLNRFFDKVIEQRYFQKNDLNSSLERKKLQGMTWN